MKTLPRMATEALDRGKGFHSNIEDLEVQDGKKSRIEMQCRGDVEIVQPCIMNAQSCMFKDATDNA
jgi:hypothetical protein